MGEVIAMNVWRGRVQRLGIVMASVIVYIIFQEIFSIGCPIKYFLHIPCAGCGMTRAVKCAIVGDFRQAFCYHPLYLLVPCMGAMIIFSDLFSKKVNHYFWYSVGGLFTIVYGMRFILHSQALFYG